MNRVTAGSKRDPASCRHPLLRLLAGFAFAAGAVVAASSASAQSYPAKPIRIIVPTGAGNVTDGVARTLATHMGKAMGQPVVVENIPGAGGVTGTQQMVRAPNDGYTLAQVNNAHTINPGIFRQMPFDSLKDVTPISVIGSTPLTLLVNPSVPARDLRELLALAKARPGALTYGSSGNGSVLHLAGVLLTSEGNVDIKHVPYKTIGQMITDVVAGHIDMAIFAAPAALPQIQAGRLRPIGVTTATRSAILPDVPTLAEAGLPNYNFGAWLALIGPAGLPPPVVDRINAELRAALAQKEVQEAFAKFDVLPIGSTVEYATQFFRSELDKHLQLVKRSGATLQ
jgi:tripartite-type tricarboxylate transporter receptor subunit TctC